MNREHYPFSMNSLYKSLNITKQSFHQFHNRLMKRLELESHLRVIIHKIRADHPKMGCRDMYYMIQPEGIGRDRFEEFCYLEGFGTERVRNYRKTTDSSGVIRFRNRTIGLKVNKLNQLWVSDITYFELNGRFYYITFIIDAYSRRVLGHSTSKGLKTEQTTLPALKKAIRTRKKDVEKITDVVFHSDGGGQYYDHEFLKLTKRYHFKNSMCVHSWENPFAERVNGVIKNNYLIDREINSYRDLIKEVDRSVKLYNEEKPHISLKRLTPIEFEISIFAKGKCSDDEESTEKESLNAHRVKPCGLKASVPQTQM